MKSLLIHLLLFCASAGSVLAQTGQIKGYVTSSDGPVVGANVGIQELQIGSSTDSEGYFTIKRVPAGIHRVRISAVGYTTLTHQVTLQEGETRELEIRLTPSTLELDQVVVTGTMRETFVKESPVKVAVVKPARLQQGKTSSNIMDLIGNVSGLSTQLNCGVCGTNAIRVNGIEGTNTAVLIDGMPIMDALASVYGLNGISPSIIDQVEVIKGPQSTLYGTQALGGVVNIITKNPELTPTFIADLYVKNTQESSINLAVSPKAGRFKGFVSGNFDRMENFFDRNDDTFNDMAKRTSVALFGKGTLEGLNGENRLTIATKLYREDRTGGVKTFTDDMRGSNQVYGESIYTQPG
ncbi:MAG: carboxypeptidase-like regulatory domain-containing protein [Balneolaceae bacterium]|nr:carboxypeptidase-like regulatory domain-containing protein [Balneolaceae bacterium]